MKILKFTLNLTASYFVVGAFAHFFGLTIFPFYDGRLHTPYHDTIIALAAVTLALLLFSIARDPEKNRENIYMVIIAGSLGIAANFWILAKIDFAKLGAPEKHFQTIVEQVLLVALVATLLISRPKKPLQTKDRAISRKDS